jgi:ABC-type multidrug transport system ATPase subunit/signal transduction histidine kinase
VSGTPETSILSIRGLSAHHGSRRALDEIDLDVRRGAIVALAGENGAGKSTLVRCIAGDLTPTAGEIVVDGERLRPGPIAAGRRGIAVVWQDLALCDNLDVAANLLLGRERRRLLFTDAAFHREAARLLDSFGIHIADTTTPVAHLSGGQRQLLAVARAMRDRPDLLVLDEPTASVGALETEQVERLMRKLCDEGTTILLVSHDIDQMFRLAERVTVLRHGRVVASVPTATGYPDEIVALMSGQAVDSSPRRQLDRLQSLVGRLSSAEPSASLAVILSALGTALAADRLCIHLREDDRLRLTASVGMPSRLRKGWSDLPCSAAGGPPGAAASSGTTVLDEDVRSAATWTTYRNEAERDGIRSSWSVPVSGSTGIVGVITVFRRNRGVPHRDELDLVTLYAGYAASAAERDRLLGQVTARNRVLETIRVVLEGLAGPVPLHEKLAVAIETLRDGLGADEVALLGHDVTAGTVCRGWSGRPDGTPAEQSPLLSALSRVLSSSGDAPVGVTVGAHQVLGARIDTGGDKLALLASWPADSGTPDASSEAAALVEDAARSLQLALERESSERAHRETAALRRSQDLQRNFLSRLSHELRTPLTAIHGYADSLLQTDVEWDVDTKSRFLTRIVGESARLSRLVADLLDLSTIESNLLRLHRDWCDLTLVLEAARGCLPLGAVDRVRLDCSPLPQVWADHDRLEQVFVNLMDNAIRHNPPGTTVSVTAHPDGNANVVIDVVDDGIGMLGDDAAAATVRDTSGAGLGLSIAQAIVGAHGGALAQRQIEPGTWWRIELPIGAEEAPAQPVAVGATGD